MSELISREEAKLAWANGKKLQIANTIVGEDFYDMDESNTTLNIFDLDFYKFRIKPRTITLNNIEVPACGENYKEGEEVYVLDDCCDERGYIEYSVSGHNFEGLLPKLWWRTEEEIKQVVAALRSVFKGGV